MKRLLFFFILVAFGMRHGPVFAGPQFCDEFVKCRENFLNTIKVERKFRRFTIAIPSLRPAGVLPVDVVEIPATHSNQNLVIISSGIHGAEAFTGSTLQTFFIEHLLPAVDRRGTTFLLIHILNPWGAISGRRVTESNVDLNRNFSSSNGIFETRNAKYADLNGFLNPDGPARTGFLDQAGFHFQLLWNLVRMSTRDIRHATLRGQYEYPRGIYFGGKKPEPVVGPILQKIENEMARRYQRMLVIDIHTGYGRRGFMHAMPDPLPERPAELVKKSSNLMRTTLAGYPLEDVANDPDFYPSTGDFSAAVTAIGLVRDIPSVPLLLEFGTLDSQTLRGSIESLRRMVQENRLRWYGAKSAAEKEIIQRDFRQLFLPDDANWRSAVPAQFAEHVPKFITRFQNAED